MNLNYDCQEQYSSPFRARNRYAIKLVMVAGGYRGRVIVFRTGN